MAKRRSSQVRDFFISYTAKDVKWATWVAEVLESEGYTTTIQAWDFGASNNFVHDMNAALESCRRTVLIYSPAYFKSLYAEAEWSAAFTQDPNGSRGTLLPIRVVSCEPPRLLRPIVYVDLVDVDDPKEARDRVILAARPRAAARVSSGFPGGRARPQRTLFDVARSLRDVLNTTRITFNAQLEARDALHAAIRKRLKIRESLEYEDFFHKYFGRLNAVELRQHAIIRDYTRNVLRDYNERALKLCDELDRSRDDDVDLEEEVPHLVDLHEHLTVWLQKYKSVIRMPSTCLVYLAPTEKLGFPSEVDDELEDLLASVDRRRARRVRTRGWGEGREG
jgi:hypothetical protein